MPARLRRPTITLTVLALVWPVGMSSRVALADEVRGNTFDPDAPQCGHWSILRACELLGVPVQMRAIMEMLPPKRQGHSMLELAGALRKIGLQGIGRRAGYQELCGGGFPVIAHLSGDHFVTVSKADDRIVYLFDGGGRPAVMSAAEFRTAWDGVELVTGRRNGDDLLPTYLGRRRRGLPCIRFDRLIIDKGQVPWNGKPIVYDFVLRNIGESPLVIEKIRTDCRCLSSKAPSLPLGPGEKGSLSLRYTLREGEGPFMHQAFVKTNDPSVPLVRLTASGNTETKIQVSPKYAYLGQIVPGQRSIALVFLHFTGDLPLEIRALRSTEKRVRLAHRPLTAELAQHIWSRARPCKGCVLTRANTHVVQIAFQAESGDCGKRLKGTVVICTNISGFEEISVPISAEIVNPIRLYPGVLSFADVEPDKEVKKSVTAVSLNHRPFKVVSVDTKGAEMTWSVTELPGENRAVLSFSGKGAAAIRLSGREIEIGIAGSGVPETVAVKLPVYAREQNSLKAGKSRRGK